MAATLLAIKARLLLPQPACESDEEESERLIPDTNWSIVS